MIRSLIYQLHQFLGPDRPSYVDRTFSRCLAALLGDKVPDTFADKNTFHGLMFTAPRKGCAQQDLAARISDNYRSLYLSKLRSETLAIGENIDVLDEEVLKATEALANCNDTDDWLKHLADNFVSIIIGGIDVTARSEVLSFIRSCKCLSKRHEQLVIHSLNHQVQKFLDPTKQTKHFVGVWPFCWSRKYQTLSLIVKSWRKEFRSTIKD